MLQKKETLDILNDIHEYFVAPIDKTHSNVAFFFWQSFYALVLIKELGLDQHTTSLYKTYIQIN